MLPKDTERRRDPRATVGIQATVLVRHNAGVPFCIEDISVGGCSLVGPATLSVGDRVQLLFEVDNAPLDVVADVIRADHVDMLNDRIAVTFIDVQAATHARIQRLVAEAIELACDQVEHDRASDP